MRIITIVVEDTSRPGHVFRVSQNLDRNIVLQMKAAVIANYLLDTLKMLNIQINDDIVRYDHEHSHPDGH